MKSRIRNNNNEIDFNYIDYVLHKEIRGMIKLAEEDSYNNAIDDFANKLIELANSSTTHYVRIAEKETLLCCGIVKIAKELKRQKGE